MKEDDSFTIVLYGDSGTGKSTIGAKAGRNKPPLILLTEPNGLSSIRSANPEAEIIQITSFAQFRKILAWLREKTAMAVAGKEELPWEFVVIDSFTDAQNMLKQEMIEKLFKLWKRKNSEEQDPDRISLNQNQWGNIGEKSILLFREFRNLPILHKIVICLQESVAVLAVGEDGEKLFRQPQCLCRKSVPGNILNMSNVVGMTFRGGVSKRYGILFSTDSQEAMTKNINTLNAKEPPDINKLIDKLRAGSDPTKFIGWMTCPMKSTNSLKNRPILERKPKQRNDFDAVKSAFFNYN